MCTVINHIQNNTHSFVRAHTHTRARSGVECVSFENRFFPGRWFFKCFDVSVVNYFSLLVVFVGSFCYFHSLQNQINQMIMRAATMSIKFFQMFFNHHVLPCFLVLFFFLFIFIRCIFESVFFFIGDIFPRFESRSFLIYVKDLCLLFVEWFQSAEPLNIRFLFGLFSLYFTLFSPIFRYVFFIASINTHTDEHAIRKVKSILIWYIGTKLSINSVFVIIFETYLVMPNEKKAKNMCM